MGKTAEELRQDIELRRSNLTNDFDAIGDRVSPGRIVERRTDAVKGRFKTVRESVMGTADHVGEQARDTVGGLRAQAGDAAGTVASSASGAVHAAEDGIHTAGEKAAEVPGMVREQTQGNPLAAGLVAFGLGLLVATVLPESRKERQLARTVQPHLEDAARATGDTGRALAEDLKPAVQDSAQHLQESARESAQHVTDTAKDAARSVTAEAKDKAADVKDAARS
jgi:cell division septum initiation protein DivIVA